MMLVTAVPAQASAASDVTVDAQIAAQVSDIYTTALRSSGLWSFYNRCSTLVNHSLLALGIENRTLSCHGRDEYNQFDGLEMTTGGYEIHRYSARDYSLEGALNAITENGTKNVTNILLGFQSGTGGASSVYGHTCMIHTISGGTVYFVESYGLSLANEYYRSGQVIACTIAEFAEYYNKWAYFEGAIHFQLPDTSAPVVSEAVRVSDVSGDGFTLTFEASDDRQITSVYAQVWTCGGSQISGYQLINGTWEDGTATIQVDTRDFDGFDGHYYAVCYAADGATEPAATAQLSIDADECLCMIPESTSVSLALSDENATLCVSAEDAMYHPAANEDTVDQLAHYIRTLSASLSLVVG